MNRRIYPIIVLSIIIGVIVTVIGASVQTYSIYLVPLGISFITGSLVGVIVAYSQSLTRAITELERHDNNIILREGYKQSMLKLILQITEVIL